MSEPLDLPLATAALNTCPCGVLLVQADVVHWVNRTLTEWLGLNGADLVGRRLPDLRLPVLEQLLSANRSLAVDQDGANPRWLRASRQTINAGETIWVAFYVSDDTERHRLDQRLQDQALTDPVTGLPNRRALLMLLEPQVSRCRRYDTPLTVMVMTLAEGDSGLGEAQAAALHIAVSRTLKEHLRWADLIGSDGRNFVIVLPETRRDDAQALADKLTQRLARLSVPGLASPPRPAFGLCEWQKGEDAASLLNNAAEQALAGA